MNGPSSLSLLASLRESLEMARRVRNHDDLVAALDVIARVMSERLGYRTVTVTLHRPQWDDFEATTVHGSLQARRSLLGMTSTWAQWAPYLASRFERRGAHHIIAGGVPARIDHLRRHLADGAPSEHPLQWDPQDLLVVTMRRSDGEVLGMLSVDEPASGQRPTDDDLDRLVAMAQVAALAVEQAQEARRDAEHRSALERLLSVSSRIAGQRSRNGVLDAVCAGIHEALGFEHVAVLVADERGALRAAATAGRRPEDPIFASMTVGKLSPLLQPSNERHGCYLLECETADAVLGLPPSTHRSHSSGCGPYAWDRHWLLVPMVSSDDTLRGLIWADDPADRLLPSRERLQALRLLADQAVAAVQAAGDFEATTHRAEHDALTGLANRATIADRLDHALQRVQRAQSTIAVLFIDLDQFKEINDSLGHGAGDELLRVMAARIDAGVRPGDTVARFGGDEFVVLCEDITGAQDAVDVAERLRASLAQPVPLAGGVTHVTASIGVAVPDRPGRSAEAMLQAADRAMYEAKAVGRDATRLATPDASWP